MSPTGLRRRFERQRPDRGPVILPGVLVTLFWVGAGILLAALFAFLVKVEASIFGMPGLAAGAEAQTGDYDLLIRGGRVLDGSGNPWFRADVGVRDGRIVALGQLEASGAARVINAAERYVTPGFIDTHSHTAGGLSSEDRSGALPLLTQGITTVVVNADGTGPIDLAAQRAALETHGLGVNVAQLCPTGRSGPRFWGSRTERRTTPSCRACGVS